MIFKIKNCADTVQGEEEDNEEAKYIVDHDRPAE
ncbi:UNVERIFIED_CONTAM: hypothetical protein C7383_10843 [Murimonas intestini]|uniref:Uncharacterized protein n=1 Tax=Murimonas intestini TaxID=1337051 RepID=A0AB73T2A1_9FIRM